MLSRELLEGNLYFSEKFTRSQAYIDLCMLAAYRERSFFIRGNKITLQQGQLAKSEEDLAERWKWSRNTVRRFLNEQQECGNIEQHKSRIITIISIKFGIDFKQQNEHQNDPELAQQNEQQFAQQNEQLTRIIEEYKKEIEELKKENEKLKEELTNVSKKKEKEKNKKEKDELFEECWVAYGRKGKKKDALTCWGKLSEDDKSKILQHIKAYVSTREYQFRKDFERYLHHRTFETIVVNRNRVIYDPEKFNSQNKYHPDADGIFQIWDEEKQCLIFNGHIEQLDDGYTEDTRPDGATVAWQMYTWKWSADRKEWIKQE